MCVLVLENNKVIFVAGSIRTRTAGRSLRREDVGFEASMPRGESLPSPHLKLYLTIMDIGSTLISLIAILLVVVAFLIKPIRKTAGLLLTILGAIISLTLVGVVIGVPMILVGGILLFS